MKSIHAKPYPFGGVGRLRKNAVTRNAATITPKPISRKPARATPFTPPQDGKPVKIQTENDSEEAQATLQKRQRFIEPHADKGRISTKEEASAVNNVGISGKQATNRNTQRDKQFDNMTWENEMTASSLLEKTVMKLLI